MNIIFSLILACAQSNPEKNTTSDSQNTGTKAETTSSTNTKSTQENTAPIRQATHAIYTEDQIIACHTAKGIVNGAECPKGEASGSPLIQVGDKGWLSERLRSMQALVAMEKYVSVRNSAHQESTPKIETLSVKSERL